MDNRRRSIAVGVGAVALGLVAFGAFDSGTDQQGVCVDRETQVRDDDVNCNGGSFGTHAWYYIPSGSRAPAVGQPTSGQGSFAVPAGQSFSKGGVSADGGQVTRGGFLSGKGTFGG